MAKSSSKSAKLVSPLYESGSTNGPVGGPKGGESPGDPLGYIAMSGMKAPGGAPSDRQASSYGDRPTAKQMAIPAGMMPGSAGPPVGGPPGPAPGGGGPDQILGLLASLQQAAPSQGQDDIFAEAIMALGMLYQRIALRSPKAAQSITKAQGEVQKAKETLSGEGSSPLPGPPNLGTSGGMAPSGPGAMGPF